MTSRDEQVAASRDAGSGRTAEAMDAVDPLDFVDAEVVNRALAHTRLGGSVRHFPAVESTNDLALAAARGGAEQGVWVADEQTAGRGRGGHAWHSAPGEGLYVSAVWTPQLPASVSCLSLAAGLAAWDSIREVAGITVDVRWPNDLVTRGNPPSLKLGGILTETAAKPPQDGSPAMLRYAVIGIGINVAHPSFPPELQDQATSLYLLGWHRPSRQALLITLLRKLDLLVQRLEDNYADDGNGAEVLARLPEASTWIHGKQVRVGDGEDGYTGVTMGLDAHGFLQVRSADGQLHTVRSGGVREA